MPTVTVVVPARDAASTIARTLEALEAARLPGPPQVIVVDDGSEDDTARIAADAGAHVVQGSGEGPGAARNLGAAESDADVLAFTDADCVPDPDWLPAGLAAAADADVVQGAVVGAPAAALGPFARSLGVGGETGLYESANLFVRREAFDRVGGFEPWLSPRRGKELGEDVWLGWRIRRAGGRTLFCPGARVTHEAHPRGPRGYVAERARLRFFPAIVRRIPELRRRALFARVFLSRRSAAFDAALAGGAAGLATGSALLLGAALPYALIAARRPLEWGRRAPLVVAVDLVADAVGLAALLAGSIRARRAVL